VDKIKSKLRLVEDINKIVEFIDNDASGKLILVLVKVNLDKSVINRRFYLDKNVYLHH